MPTWIIWAIAAVLLAIGELFTPGLFFLGPIALAALAATIVVASAASAIGPRKKRPGVKISPTARRTATIAQMSQAGMS